MFHQFYGTHGLHPVTSHHLPQVRSFGNFESNEINKENFNFNFKVNLFKRSPRFGYTTLQSLLYCNILNLRSPREYNAPSAKKLNLVSPPSHSYSFYILIEDDTRGFSLKSFLYKEETLVPFFIKNCNCERMEKPCTWQPQNSKFRAQIFAQIESCALGDCKVKDIALHQTLQYSIIQKFRIQNHELQFSH